MPISWTGQKRLLEREPSPTEYGRHGVPLITLLLNRFARNKMRNEQEYNSRKNSGLRVTFGRDRDMTLEHIRTHRRDGTGQTVLKPCCCSSRAAHSLSIFHWPPQLHNMPQSVCASALSPNLLAR